MSRLSIRLATTVLASVIAIGVAAPLATAHVGVISRTDKPKQTSAELISFFVPNERDNASTTKLEVAFPTDQPLATVSPQTHPGWSVKLDKTKLDQPLETGHGPVSEVVSTITWTANNKDAAIQPEAYDQFWVYMSPLPKADQMVFKALQTYDTGEVVRWIEEPTPGGVEPEHPAPVLRLTAASAEDTSGQQAKATSSSSTQWALGLSIGAILFGLASTALVVRGWLKSRNSREIPEQ